MSYEHIMERRSVVLNDGWKPEAFFRSIEKHLGSMHPIAPERDVLELGVTSHYVGFGDESAWRGKVYRKGETVVALELISNSDKKIAEVTMATMGLAVLSHNKFAYFSDVICEPYEWNPIIPEGWTKAQAVGAYKTCKHQGVDYRLRDWVLHREGYIMNKEPINGMFIGIEPDGYTHT